MTPKRTADWSDADLDYLEARYGLDGPASISAHLQRTLDSVKQMATRLDLSSEMHEYTPIPDVAREAGVSIPAVHQWIHYRPGYARHCRTWGGRLNLMPLPMVREYLHATRRDTRPVGWWGSARTAEHLDCTIANLQTLPLTRAQFGHTLYYDPHAVQQFALARTPAPPLHYIRLIDVTNNATTAASWLKANGYSVQHLRHPTTHQIARYSSADATRAFLSSRGHREEMVDTLLRKALSMDASRVKVSDSDTGKAGHPEG